MNLDNLVSGRFWLAIMVGAVFVYAACMNILEAKDILIICMIVFRDYFNKKDAL